MHVDHGHLDVLARHCRDQEQRRAAALWPPRISRFYASLIDRDDPDDPLLRQVLPDGRECHVVPGYDDDPLAEQACRQDPGLLSKYPGRVLVLCDGPCAVRCRFCFRRHLRGRAVSGGSGWLKSVRQALIAYPDCHEVVLSGGDPLGMAQDRVRCLLAACDALPQIKRIRLHTRYPVAEPSCISADLTASLAAMRAMVVMVLHINHPREVSPELMRVAARLRQAGVHLYAQSVLLRGVNDQLETLLRLGEALADAGIVAYYLHQLDRVAGAAHFAVDDARARRLHAAWRASASGYLVPRLVREVAGRPCKTPL